MPRGQYTGWNYIHKHIHKKKMKGNTYTNMSQASQGAYVFSLPSILTDNTNVRMKRLKSTQSILSDDDNDDYLPADSRHRSFAAEEAKNSGQIHAALHCSLKVRIAWSHRVRQTTVRRLHCCTYTYTMAQKCIPVPNNRYIAVPTFLVKLECNNTEICWV